ncbi:invasion associated locus B family protein [Aureimonas glaciei]|uniref:Invasion associated locus B family protein n=1 Tax=Aureimonas glaciei TaxID=1776957 RepID=A0A916XSN5_9HYPH|nr:invasion associated locus B family protein [Aureimonas glaciei]GGD04954.1 hypothetical protein GCM10011335_04730 [Aureimonas glaciei]
MRVGSKVLVGSLILLTGGWPASAQQSGPTLTSPTSGGTLGTPADPNAPFRSATPSQPISAGSTAPVATVAPPAPESGTAVVAPNAPPAGAAGRSGEAPVAKGPAEANESAATSPVPSPDANPRPLQASKSVEYGDWTLECFTPAVAGVNCQATSRVLSADTKQSVLVFSIVYIPAQEASRVQAALPLGFSLPQGVQIDIGATFQSSIDVNRCTAQGCLIEGSAAPALIAAMRKESTGSFTVRTTDLVPIRIPLSLKGFTQAYEAMVKANVREVTQK